MSPTPPRSRPRLATGALALALPLLAVPPLAAQTKAPQQIVRPPVAQLWMDVATATMPGMPDMPSMPSIGGMFGRGG
ncbi:MAG: hypothetical protein ACK58C_05045, partial [Betaproteobacteria bacterium]